MRGYTGELVLSWTLSANISNSTSTVTTGDRSEIEVNTPRTYTGEGNLAVWLIKESRRVGRPERLQRGKESSGHAITPRWTSFRVPCAHERKTSKDPAVVAEDRAQAGVSQSRARSRYRYPRAYRTILACR